MASLRDSKAASPDVHILGTGGAGLPGEHAHAPESPRVHLMPSILSLLPIALAAWVGLRLRGAPRRSLRRTVAGCAVGVVVWAAIWQVLLDPLVGRAPWLAPFDAAPARGLTLICMFALAWLSPEAWLRRPMLFLTGLVGAYATFASLGALWLAAGDWGLDDTHDPGPSLQCTWWSCGPATAAALARDLGLTPSEREAAVLCNTGPLCGTSPSGLAAGLSRLTGRPWRSIMPARNSDLARAATPCLACTRVYEYVPHVVLIRSMTERSVDTWDPMCGESTIPLAEFRRVWLRILTVPR